MRRDESAVSLAPRYPWCVRADVLPCDSRPPQLKLTLTPKFLAKPLVDALVTPFLGAYNKKMKDATPITAADLVRVEVDGLPVADISAPAGDVLKSSTPKVELFPPGSAPAASKPAEPMDVSDPAPAPAAGGGEAKPMASNTMPKCKYGLACRIIDPVIEGTSKSPIESQHWYECRTPLSSLPFAPIAQHAIKPSPSPTSNGRYRVL